MSSIAFRNKELDGVYEQVSCLHNGGCYTNRGLPGAYSWTSLPHHQRPWRKYPQSPGGNCPKIAFLWSLTLWNKQFPASQACPQWSRRESWSSRRLDLWWQKRILADIEEQVGQLLAMVFENYKSLDEASPSGLADTFVPAVGAVAPALVPAVQLYTLLHDILSVEAQCTLRNYFQVCKLHSLETKEGIFPALVVRCPDILLYLAWQLHNFADIVLESEKYHGTIHLISLTSNMWAGQVD